MNDEDCLDDIEITVSNRDAYLIRSMSNFDLDFALVNEAMRLILQVMYADDSQKLEEQCMDLADRIDAEMQSDSPNLQKCRLWKAGWNAFMKSAETPCPDCGQMVKDAVLDNLERNLSDQLNQRSLLVFAVNQKLGGCATFETVPSLRN